MFLVEETLYAITGLCYGSLLKQIKERNLLHDPINAKKITHLAQTQFNLPLLKYVFEFRVGCAEHQR